MKAKKIISFILAAALMLSLAACSNGEGTDNPSPDQSSPLINTDSNTPAGTSVMEAVTLADELGYGYITEYAIIPYEYDYMSQMLYQDGRVYMLVSIENSDTLKSEMKLISMLPDCTDLLEHPLPELSENANIRSISIDSDGSLLMYVYEYSSGQHSRYGTSTMISTSGGGYSSVVVTNSMSPPEDEPEEAPSEQSAIEDEMPGDSGETGEEAQDDDGISDAYAEAHRLIKCDSEGNITKEVDLLDALSVTVATGDYWSVDSMAVDKNGNIYLSTMGMNDIAVCVLDSEMNFLFKLDNIVYYINSLTPYKDTVLVGAYSQEGEIMSPVDLEKRSLGESLSVPVSYMDSYRFALGENDNAYLYDSSNLYTYDAETGTASAILNWIDTDINSNNTSNMIIVSDELIIMNYYDHNLGTSELLLLKQVPVSEIPVKTVLTFACVYLDYEIRDAIISFNRTNPTYRITIKDYSKYMTDGDYMTPYNQLNNDLLAGNLPDILSLSNLNANNYSSKGLLADLYQFIDSDPELSREYFVDGLLNAMEDTDGNLYQIGYSFYIVTMVGLTEVVGDSLSWTFEEMMQAYRSMPEGTQLMQGMTKSDFLETFLMVTVNDFINYETGECSFNSEEFINLLEIANSFPKDYDSYYNEDDTYRTDGDLLRSGEIMLAGMGFSGFDGMDIYRAMFSDLDVSYKGFPSSNGTGVVVSMDGMAICSASQYQEGAWEFIKLMLGDDFQSNLDWYFPVQKAAFEQSALDAMEPDYYIDENGEKVEAVNTVGINGVQYEMPPLTQEQVDEIKELVASINKVITYDSEDTTMGIVKEEAESFFSGQKSAQEVANLIQSRVSTYILESM